MLVKVTDWRLKLLRGSSCTSVIFESISSGLTKMKDEGVSEAEKDKRFEAEDKLDMSMEKRPLLEGSCSFLAAKVLDDAHWWRTDSVSSSMSSRSSS